MPENLFSKAEFEIWLCTPVGERLQLMEYTSGLSLSKAHGAVGRATVAIPLSRIPRQYIRPDYVITVFRKPPGESISREVFTGFVREYEFVEENGQDMVKFTFEDGLTLIENRIIAYASGETQADKSDFADDMMKEIVRENLGSSAEDTTRDLSSYDFTVQINTGQGPTLNERFAWRKVLETLNDISLKAIYNDNPVFFDIVPLFSGNTIGWQFVTRAGQLASDRTYDVNNPTVFSREFGNLEDPSLRYDYSSEATYVYAGGQGEGIFREIVELEDTTRASRSSWNRREVFVNYANAQTTAQLTDKAEEVLQAGRPVIHFTGKLKDTPQARYGVRWNYGDKVTVRYLDVSLDAWINAIAIRVDSDGKESINARVEAYL